MNSPLYRNLQPGRQTGRSCFTLIELLVVISIIAVLMSILAPALSRARQAAQGIHCLNQLRQIGMAGNMYINDSGDCFPGTYWFYPVNATNSAARGSICGYLPGLKDWNQLKDTLLTCATLQHRYPSDSTFHLTYTINALATSLDNDGKPTTSAGRPFHAGKVKFPGMMSFFFDGLAQNPTASGWYYKNTAFSSDSASYMRFPHRDGENVVFVDGHVERIGRPVFMKQYFINATDRFWTGR